MYIKYLVYDCGNKKTLDDTVQDPAEYDFKDFEVKGNTQAGYTIDCLECSNKEEVNYLNMTTDIHVEIQ